MNPLITIAASGAAIVGAVGLSTLPPESSTTASTVAYDPGYEQPVIPEGTESPLTASETSVPAPDGYCPQILETASLVGFTEPEAALLSRIAWHESRCQEEILGDLNRGVSYGLLQIHGPTWCEPSRYWPDGYLQTKRVLDECEDLFDPAISVIAARLIVKEGGFEQWSTYAAAVNE